MPVKNQQHSKMPLVAVQCQYKYNLGLEDEHKCLEALSDEEWRYCKDHRESGPEQYKAQHNGLYVQDYRDKWRQLQEYYGNDEYQRRNSNDQLRHRLKLTEPQLEPLLQNAEALQEEDPSHKDDFYQDALDKLNKIPQTLLNPPLDLCSSSQDAREQAKKLFQALKNRQASYPSHIIDHFVVHVQEYFRDIARPFSPGVFTVMARESKKVREQRRQQGQLLNIVHALFVEAELHRLQFISNPPQRQFLQRARARLHCAKFICELAHTRYTGEQNKIAQYLLLYAHEREVDLALDGGEPQQVTQNIQSIQKYATAVTNAYGTGEVAITARFLSSLTQAEYHMRLNNLDLAQGLLTEAEQVLSALTSRSIEFDLMLAYINASLALARGDQNRHEDLHTYIDLCKRFPFVTHLKHLRELKRAYKHDVPEIPILKGDSCFVDSMFRHIYPYLLTV